MKVADVMTQDVITVTPATPLKEVATLLVQNGIGGVAVVEDDDILGVVSETDLLYKERGPARRTGSWAASVSVHVQDGHVTLRGRVETLLIAELLPDAARRVPGVVSVDADLSFARRN